MSKTVPLITQQGLLTFPSLVLPVFAVIIYGNFWSSVKSVSKKHRTDQLAQSSLHYPHQVLLDRYNPVWLHGEAWKCDVRTPLESTEN